MAHGGGPGYTDRRQPGAAGEGGRADPARLVRANPTASAIRDDDNAADNGDDDDDDDDGDDDGDDGDDGEDGDCGGGGGARRYIAAKKAKARASRNATDSVPVRRKPTTSKPPGSTGSTGRRDHASLPRITQPQKGQASRRAKSGPVGAAVGAGAASASNGDAGVVEGQLKGGGVVKFSGLSSAAATAAAAEIADKATAAEGTGGPLVPIRVDGSWEDWVL